MKKIVLCLLLLSPGVFLLRAEPLSAPVLERYEQMLLKAPEPGAAFEKVYQHYLETEGLDALAKRWSQAGEMEQGADYLLLLGLLNDQRGRSEEALQNLRAAAWKGETWRGFSALAAVEVRLGKLTEAVASYQKALALDPPPDAAAKLYRGLALAQQRVMDLDGAVTTWQAYAKASPGDPFVLEEAGDALLEAGRFDEAREMFVQLRGQKDGDPARRLTASLRLAEVERQRGKKDEALKIYTEALAEAGTSSWLQKEVRGRIERLFRGEDDLPGLVGFYQQHLEGDPSDLEAALRLSEALGELNRADEALGVLQTAAEKAPENKDVQLSLAGALLGAERPSDAETVLLALAAIRPDDEVVWERLGEAQWQTFKLTGKNRDAALATWRKLAPDGADAGAVQRLAGVFRNHGLTEEALTAYRRALALDPAAADRREHLAEYLMALNRKDEAFAELSGLVADGRGSGETYLRLAKVQRRFGDNAAAKKTLTDAGALPGREFERSHLAWQIAAGEKNWSEAEAAGVVMRETASTEPERERADDCVAEALREQDKTAGEIRRLTDRQKSAPDTFTERDWRLLFVLAAGGNDHATAEYVLKEGLGQFPQSVALLKLEDAWARRTNDTVRRLAALERLQQAEPPRVADWMAERVRVLRDMEKWDEAVQLARETVAGSPARAEGHLLLADTLLAAGKPDEAAGALREAVRLSAQPNPVRLRLADLFTGQGVHTAARSVVEEAFEAEESPSGKLQLTGRLANAYLQEGRIEDLIAKLRERQKAEEGGWRYALYLAEVFQTMQDPVRSLEELDKALAGKPDDPVLLRRLFHMAESGADTTAALRYARKLAIVEPSKENRAQLGAALVAEGKSDEALDLLRDHGGEFLENPSAWQDVVRQLQAEDKIDDLMVLLEGRLRADPDDWRSLLAMAEILMGAGQTEKAAGILWRVLDLKEDPKAQSQPSPTPPPAAPPVPGSGGGHVVFFNGIYHVISSHSGVPSGQQMRQMRFTQAQQRAMQILSDDGSMNRRMGGGFRVGHGGWPLPTGTQTLADAQDDALVYLACIAVRDAREEEFLKKLPSVLTGRPLEDRLILATALQAPELVVQESENFVASGVDDPAAATQAMQAVQTVLHQRRNNPALGGGELSTERLKDLMENLSAKIVVGSNPRDIQQRYHMLLMLEKKDEADKLVDAVLAAPDPDDPAQMAAVMHMALQRKDFDRALALNEKMRSARQAKGAGGSFRGFSSLGLAMQLLGSDTHREKGLDLLVEDFVSGSGTAAATRFPFRGPMGQPQINWSQLRRGSVTHLVPLPTAALGQQQVGMLRSLAGPNPQFRDVVPELVKRFAAQAKESDSQTLREAVVWLEWFSGRQKEALAEIKEVLAGHPSDDLWVNYSLMLMETGQEKEALAALDHVQARTGTARDLAVRLRFALALQAKDDEAARAAAVVLASARLADHERSQLAQEMKRLGLKDEAETLEKKSIRSRHPSHRGRQMVELMNQRKNADDRSEALALAYALLGRDPFSQQAGNERYQQDQALQVLKKFDELDGYIGKLQAQWEATPHSARLNAQLAVALQMKDPKLAEPYYRRLAELRPKDAQWLTQLGQLLTQSGQSEEAMRLYDQILAEDPQRLLSQGSMFVQPYQRSQSWQRLLDAIAAMPDPPKNPLSPHRQNYAHVFLDLGRQVQRARPPIDPIPIWLKGLRWDPEGSWQLRPLLVRSLMRAGRTDEARKIVEETLFPADTDASSARLFVFNRQFRSNTLWGHTISYGDGRIENAGMQMLRLAAEMGVLSEWIPRIEKLPSNPHGQDPVLLARLAARDEKVLPDLRKKITTAKAVKPGQPLPAGAVNLQTWRFLADELAGWPKARDLAYEALDATEALAAVHNNDPNSLMGVHMQRITLGMEDGRKDLLKKSLRDWMEALEDWQRRGAGVDFGAAVRVMRLMADTGMNEELEELKSAIRADRNFSQTPYYQKMLAQVEKEIALSQGDPGEVAAMLAWLPGKTNGRVLWDLRPAIGGEEDNRTVWMAGEPLKKLSGKYTLEVFFGESESTMKRLFVKSAVPARGVWSGPLPKPAGFLRATLTKGESVWMGPVFPVANGVSLLAGDCLEELVTARGSSSKSWLSIPPVTVTEHKGGPVSGGKFVRLGGDMNGQMELVGKRIAVDPGKNYLLGGWFRYADNQGSARLGWRVYDAGGRELNSFSGRGNFRGDRWNQVLQTLGTGPGASRLPKEAAWLEPYVEFHGRCDLQGLFVIEGEPAATAE